MEASSDGLSLNAYDYQLEDLLKILDPKGTRDPDVIQKNLEYYQRKCKDDPDYTCFFGDAQNILTKEHVIGARKTNTKARVGAQKDAFDLSQYSIEEVATVLGYDGGKPTVEQLKKGQRAYIERFRPLSEDDAEETDNKRRAATFFAQAYDMLIAYHYPNYGALAEEVAALNASADRGNNISDAAAAVQRHASDNKSMVPETVSSQVMRRAATMAQERQERLGEYALMSGKRVKRVILNLDTRFRKNYFDKAMGDITSTSEMTFSLDERLKNVRRLSLSSLEFPNSAYAISSALKSNIFYIQVTKNMYQTRENAAAAPAQSTLGTRINELPTNSTNQTYIDHTGVTRTTTGGAVGVYRVTMMSGNYNQNTLVNAVNNALRLSDLSSGLAAIILEANSSYNRLVMRTVDLSSDTHVSQAAGILYNGIEMSTSTTSGAGRIYRGQNAMGGLVNRVNRDFSFNIFFDLYEQLNANGDYDLTKPTPYRPLYYNSGWVFGFRKAKYLWDEDYTQSIPGVTSDYETEFLPGDTDYFVGFNAESPYDINNMRYFYVCLTDYVTHGGDIFVQGIRNDRTGVHSGYGLPSDILARIVNNGPKLHYTFFDQSDFMNKTRAYDVPVTLQNFKMRLTDEYGRSLDLNGMDWSAALEILCEID